MIVRCREPALPLHDGFHMTDRLASLRVLADRRVALMLALGFSSGLPLLLVLGTFSARLAFSDIDVKTIGLFSYLALPYSLKFLWSPVVDKLDVPILARLLGRRRAWMVLSQLCVAASLTLMAFADTGNQLALLGLGAFLVVFLADWAGWTAAYLTMAALMSVGILAALAAPVLERKPPAALPEPLAAPSRRPGAVAYRAIV